MLESDYIETTTNMPPADEMRSDLTPQQLGTIRDEWLQPLLLQMRQQSEELGRIEARIELMRDACRRLSDERDELQAERDELLERLKTQPAAPDADALPPRLETALRTLSRIQISEGAAVAGIAIALGLWVVVGLFAWIFLG